MQLWHYSLQRWQITRLAVQLSQPAHTQFSADAQRAGKQAGVEEQPFKTFVSIKISSTAEETADLLEDVLPDGKECSSSVLLLTILQAWKTQATAGLICAAEEACSPLCIDWTAWVLLVALCCHQAKTAADADVVLV